MFEFGSVMLRKWEKKDLELIYKWENNYTLLLYARAMPWETPMMEDIEENYNKMVKDKNPILFIVLDRKEQMPVGSAVIRFNHKQWNVNSADIGLYIAERAHRNKGIGKTATLALLELLFFHMGFEKVTAGSAQYNSIAHKVLYECGFVKEGEIRRGIKLYGRFYSWYSFGILYEEYMGKRDKLLKDLLGSQYEEYVKMVSQLDVNL